MKELWHRLTGQTPGLGTVGIGSLLVVVIVSGVLLASGRLQDLRNTDPAAWSRVIPWLMAGPSTEAMPDPAVTRPSSNSEGLPSPAAPFGLSGRDHRALVKAASLVLWFLMLQMLLYEGAVCLLEAPRSVQLAAPAILLGSLALRTALATFGPGDFYFSLFQESYGIAFTQLMQVFRPWLAGDPVRLAMPTLIVSVLVPILVMLFVWEVRRNPVQAILAGGTAGILPVLVRFSGMASSQAFLWFLGASALLGMARYARHRDRIAPILVLAACVLALETRQEGVILAGVVVLFGLLHVDRRRFGAGLWLVLGLITALALVRLAAEVAKGTPVRTALMLGNGQLLPALKNLAVFDPNVTSWVFLALLLVSLMGAFLENWRWGAWLLAAMVVFGLPTAQFPIAGVHLANLRYQSLAFLVVAVAVGCAAGLGIERVKRRWRSPGTATLAGAAFAGIGASLLPGFQAVSPQRTIEAEYRFVAQAVMDLPKDARIYLSIPELYVPGYNPPGLVFDILFQDYSGHVLGLPGQLWIVDGQPEPAGSGPRFYYHQAACSSTLEYDMLAENQRTCVKNLDRYGSRPVAEADLPSRPFAKDTYSGDTVRVGFYAMDEARPAGTRPNPPIPNPTPAPAAPPG